MTDVQMVFPTMHQMVATFNESAETLEDIMASLKVISGLVDGGALVGKGGQKFIDLLENGIMPFTSQMQEKLYELASDVNAARAFLEEGDTTAASRFA